MVLTWVLLAAVGVVGLRYLRGGVADSASATSTAAPGIDGRGRRLRSSNVSHARIGILVVAYNAVSTLGEVLDRIPDSLRDSIDVVLVSDDHSTDRTYEAALEYQRTHDALPIAVVRQRRNLGYGGNQKFGYRWLAEHGCDIAVLLHGDGQYAPEVLPEIVAPLLEGRADVVLGSRMLTPGVRVSGGMPLYKYVGNKILTRFQNRVSGLVLSEWHSGYRAFSLDALARIPFEENSDGFDFDTEVLLQLLDSGARIVEVPIPTYYGDEICRVNGLAYARDVCLDVAALPSRAPRFRRLPPCALVERLRVEGRPRRKPSRRSRCGGRAAASAGSRSRPRLCRRPAQRRASRARASASSGSTATRRQDAEDNVDRLVVADLDAGLPAEAAEEGPFDVILAVDVLEHLRDPSRLLRELHGASSPEATLISSVPNIAHWYPRLRIGFGRFDYDRRGILDATHLRFFTWRSFAAMAARVGWQVEQRRLTGLPLEVLGLNEGTCRPPRVTQGTRARRPRRTSGVAVALRVPVRRRAAPRPCVRFAPNGQPRRRGNLAPLS